MNQNETVIPIADAAAASGGCSSCQGGSCAGACAGYPYVCLDIRAQKPASLRSLSRRLGDFTIETRKILTTLPGVEGPFADEDDYMKRAVVEVDTEVRVYKIKGHVGEIIVPTAYDLDSVRALRQQIEDLSPDADGQLRSGLLGQLATHPYGDRFLPEDIVAHLDECPDARYFGTIYMLNQSNHLELWLRLSYDRNFVSSASVKPNGDIMFYRGKKDIFLRDNVFHEWSHRLEQKFPELSKCWADTLELENGWVPRTYAFRSYEEHFAVIAEPILALDCGRFLEAANNAPLRVAVWLSGLKKALVESLESRPSCYHVLYCERARYGLEVLKPKALEYLKGAKTRAGQEVESARKAVAENPSDNNRSWLSRAEKLLPEAEEKAARVAAFLNTWLV